MTPCAHCPVGPDCPRFRSDHRRYCEWCDPDHPDHNPTWCASLVAIARGEPTRTVPDASPRLDIPLAGNVVESLARRIGADRLAKWWERQTGVPCGCAERREKLNRATGRLVRWLNSGTTRTNIVHDPRSSRDSGR